MFILPSPSFVLYELCESEKFLQLGGEGLKYPLPTMNLFTPSSQLQFALFYVPHFPSSHKRCVLLKIIHFMINMKVTINMNKSLPIQGILKDQLMRDAKRCSSFASTSL